MDKSEKEKLEKSKQINEDIKIIGECVASDDLIGKLSDLKVKSKSKPVDQVDAVVYAGIITFQDTPEKCKKVKDVPIIPITDIVATGKMRGGKCRLLDKTRADITKAMNKPEIGVKKAGKLGNIKVTDNHKQGFQDSIDEINKLKKEYDCKYD